ncbi:GAF domain-containing sensor histidine kinase [Paenibacillus kobensis]|uniref:GAF domain-containing sensor histidine kinase n=1 Tax=Paenibacillus kobensis TaxID=59841 RepID=UPI001FEB5CFA|nr:GAF domain-containing sensor histidine kinase [Paenibacillus kobensis]
MALDDNGQHREQQPCEEHERRQKAAGFSAAGNVTSSDSASNAADSDRLGQAAAYAETAEDAGVCCAADSACIALAPDADIDCSAEAASNEASAQDASGGGLANACAGGDTVIAHPIGDAHGHQECEAALKEGALSNSSVSAALMVPKHRVQEMILLKIIAETLNQSNELSTMLQSVLEKLMELSGLTTGWIFLSESYMDFCSVAEQNLPPALTGNGGKRMNHGSCWCLDRFWDGRLVNAINILNCKRLEDAATFRWGDTYGITHHATVPLRTGKKLVGILNVAAPGKTHFTDDELALLQSVAFQIGGAIERIRLYAAEQRRAELFARLDEFSRALGSHNDDSSAEPLIDYALRLISTLFAWPAAALYDVSGNELALRAVYYSDEACTIQQRISLKHARWLRETALRRQVSAATPEEAGCLAFSDRTRGSSKAPYKLRTAAAVPLPFGRTGLVLVVASGKRDAITQADWPVLEAMAEHIAGALDSALLAEHRRELARIEERNRLARDLHDSVSQLLFSLSMTSRGVEGLLSGPSPDTDAALAAVRDMQSLSQSALKEMRSLILQLRPSDLQAGLVTALREYGEKLGLRVLTSVEGVRELPRAAEDALWRIGQEALNNVSKHSGMNSADISLTLSDGEAVLRVSDNGKGMPSGASKNRTSAPPSFGLSTMRERAEALGGTFSATGRRAGGTLIEVVIPLPSAAIRTEVNLER